MSLPQMLPQPTKIQFVPDPHSIGIDNPNFSRYSDAVAEFVDNSIQACSEPHYDSNIKIGIYFSTNQGFLVVADHGRGMDEAGLQKFATFALSKEFRGERPRDETDRTFIGKFGVGAKQGGFFLGDRIRTFTKSSSAQEGELWLSFTLDAEELIQRQRNQQNVYEGMITPFHDYHMVLGDDEKECSELLGDLQNHLHHDSDHGAIFIIRLKSHVADYFRRNKKYLEFERELADIHYFHLHPEHRPNHQSGRRLIAASQPQANMRAFEVQFQLFRPSLQYSSKLSQVQSFPFLCFCHARASESFKLTVPLDDNNRTFDITGLIQYFPFQDGNETRPNLKDCNDDTSPTNIIFRILWQDRSLPEASLSSLPFFPPSNQISKLIDNGMSVKWKSRIVIFLFLDWNFQSISNNKLKITQSDFENHLNSLKHFITYHPSQLKKEFERWLVDWSKSLDQEFHFYDRVLDEKRTATFSKVEILGREKEFEKENRVTLTNIQSQEKFYGIIHEFVVKESLPHREDSYIGTGFIRYRRIPEPLFGDKVCEASISKVELNAVSTAELNAYQAESKPTKIELYLVESDKMLLRLPGNTSFRCSVRYSFGVRLLRDNNKDTFSPDKCKDLCYGVTIALASQPDEVLGKCNSITVIGIPSTSASAIKSNVKPKSKLIICPDISFSVAGKIPLLIRVWSNDFSQQIIEKSIEVRCVTTGPKRAEARFFESENPPVRLGMCLPAMSLDLFDANNNVINYEGEIRIEVTSDSLDVIGKEYIGTVSGQVQVPGGHWKVQPRSKRAHLFEIANGTISSRIVTLTASVSIRGEEGWKSVSRGTITIELFPGLPSTLHQVDPGDEICVKSGASVPGLRLGCLDMWKNPTAAVPQLGESKWILCLGHGPLKEEANASCGSSLDRKQSSLSLSSQLPLSDNDVATIPVGTDSLIYLDNLRCIESLLVVSKLEQEFAVYDAQSCKRLTEVFILPITVLPDSSPKTVQLWFEDNIINDHFEYPVTAGAVVRGIEFRVLDDQGRRMDLAPYRSLGNSKVTIALYPEGKSNKAKKRSIALPDSDCINAVKAPKVKGIHFLEISFTLAGVDLLEQAITIRVLPGPPVSWQIKYHNLNEGVLNNNSEDLSAKVEYVYCVDEFDNNSLLPIDAELVQDRLKMRGLSATGASGHVSTQTQLPMRGPISQLTAQQQKPILRISRARTDENVPEEDLILPLFRHFVHERDEDNRESIEVDNGEEVRYMLPNTAVLSGFPPETTLLITAESAADCGLEYMKEHSVTTFIVGGEPAKLRLFSLAHDIQEICSNKFSISISEFDSFEDLELSILDDFGAVASALWTKKTSMVISACESTCDESNEKITLFSKKNLRRNPSSVDGFALSFRALEKYSSTLRQVPMLISFKVVCQKGEHCKELSTSLHVRIIPSNHIVDIAFFLPDIVDNMGTVLQRNYSHSDSKGILKMNVEAGCTLPAIGLELKFADEQPSIVDKTSMKLSLRPKNCCDSVTLTDFPENIGLVNSKSTRFLVNISNFNAKNSIGTYTLDARYDESRPQLSSLPSEFRQRATTMRLGVTSSHFDTLSLDERRLNKVLRHSALSKDRCFATRLDVQLLDKFQNCLDVRDDVFLICRAILVESTNDSISTLLQRFISDGLSDYPRCPPLETSNFDLNQHTELFYDTSMSQGVDDNNELTQSSQAGVLSGSKRSHPSPTRGSPIKRSRGNVESNTSVLHREINLVSLLQRIGAVVAQRRISSKKLLFENLQLCNVESNYPDGKYALRFSLIRETVGTLETMFEKDVEFSYYSAETMELKSRQIVDLGERAKAELDAFRNLKEKRRDMYDEFQSLVSDLQIQSVELNLGSLTLSQSPTLEELHNLSRHVTVELNRLETVSARPAIRQTSYLRQRLPVDDFGYVVDLGYVANQRDAELLSWAAGTWMDTIVVQRESVAVDLFRRQQLRSFAFEMAGPIGINQRVTLPSLDQFCEEVGCRPRYMYDIIELDVDREDLRSRLFWHIFQNCILVETLEHALELRKAWVRSREARSIPMIYTLDGNKVPSSGQLDPTDKIPVEMKAVFGSQDSKSSLIYQFYKSALSDIERICTLLIELDELDGKLHEFDSEKLEEQIVAADIERRRLKE